MEGFDTDLVVGTDQFPGSSNAADVFGFGGQGCQQQAKHPEMFYVEVHFSMAAVGNHKVKGESGSRSNS